jgi:hypothetical protein
VRFEFQYFPHLLYVSGLQFCASCPAHNTLFSLVLMTMFN